MPDDVEFNIQFCKVVEKYAVLYDFNRPEYYDRNAQDKAWKAIASELRQTTEFCKERWPNLRGRYAKYRRSVHEVSSGSKKVKEYYLAPYMQYLDNYLKNRPNKCNKNADAKLGPSGYDDDDDTLTEYEESPWSKEDFSVDLSTLHRKREKRKASSSLDVHEPSQNYQCSNEQLMEGDPDMAFLQSLLPDLKAMSSKQKRKFKIDVLKLADVILDEAETKINTIKPDDQNTTRNGGVS